MRLIIAIVRTFTLDRIIVGLESIENFPGMTVVESEGFGQRVKSASDAVDPLKPNKRIEIVAQEEIVADIVSAIKEHAHTGKKGDGIVVVLPLETCVKI